MFENLSHLALQEIWWVIISLLGAILVFLLFVQGGQTLIFKLGKTPPERNVIINSLGRKWEITFTTLVTFGGAIFASFPLFYSTSFGGAYWVWMAILFAFIIQAVSFEFRRKENNFLGAKTYESFLYINGVLATILLGVAVSTFFTGSEFLVDKLNITNLSGNEFPVISSWKTPYHGLEALWTISNLAFIQNISLGLAVLFLSRILGIMYFMNNIETKSIIERSRKPLLINSLLFLLFFLFWIIRLLFIDGYSVNETTSVISIEPNKYLNNIIQMPLNSIIMIVGILLVLIGIYKAIFKKDENSIWFSGSGTILTVFSIFILSGLNNTAFYPSTFDIQSSLTIQNSSSSKFTLTVMSYVALLIPFVAAYIIYAWRAMDKTKITVNEIDEDSHSY